MLVSLGRRDQLGGRVRQHSNYGCDCEEPNFSMFKGLLQRTRDFMGKCPSVVLEKACKTIRGKLPEVLSAAGTCAAAAISFSAVCACGGDLSMMSGMMLMLGDASPCIDMSGWPVSVAEVLGNYYTFKVEQSLTPLKDFQKLHWTWSSDAALRLPYQASTPSNITAPLWVDMWKWIWSGMDHEVQFWMEFLRDKKAKAETQGLQGVPLQMEGYENWVHEMLCQEVDDIAAPKMLNAGSGPINLFELPCEKRSLRFIHADALGHSYWKMYDTLGLEPQELPLQCFFEQMAACFPSNFFHVALVANALDHTFDILRSILGLLTVIRRGGKLILIHGQEVSKFEEYAGMHLWSFDVDSSFDPPHFVVRYRRRRRIDISVEFASEAAISVSIKHAQVVVEMTKQ